MSDAIPSRFFFFTIISLYVLIFQKLPESQKKTKSCGTSQSPELIVIIGVIACTPMEMCMSHPKISTTERKVHIAFGIQESVQLPFVTLSSRTRVKLDIDPSFDTDHPLNVIRNLFADFSLIFVRRETGIAQERLECKAANVISQLIVNLLSLRKICVADGQWAASLSQQSPTKFFQFWPRCLRNHREIPALNRLHDLLRLKLLGEHGHSGQHFIQSQAKREDVDLRIISFHFVSLGSLVMLNVLLLRHFSICRRRTCMRPNPRSGSPFVVDQKIRWFGVAVNRPMRVNEFNSSHNPASDDRLPG
jgi:hypothetical protein